MRLRLTVMSSAIALASLLSASMAQTTAWRPFPPFSAVHPSSTPVTKDGLSVTVTLCQPEFAPQEPLAFKVRFKNVSDKPFALNNAQNFWNWQMYFSGVQNQLPRWRVWHRPNRPESNTSVILDPRDVYEVPVALEHSTQQFQFECWGPQHALIPPVKNLKPGKYSLRVLIDLSSGQTATGPKVPFWTGKIETKPVEFQIRKTAAEVPRKFPVRYDRYGGYFVSNKFEPDAAVSFRVIQDQKSFDKVFGVAKVMHDTSHRLPPNLFATHMVVAVVKRGKATWSYKVDSVTTETGILMVRYTARNHPSTSAEFASPLILSVPKAKFSLVQFVENGKLAKEIKLDVPDLIDRLVARFSADPLWQNGLYESIHLPPTASTEELVTKVFERRFHGEASPTILTKRPVKIGPEEFTAAMVRTHMGETIVLLRYEGERVGWLIRVYDKDAIGTRPRVERHSTTSR